MEPNSFIQDYTALAETAIMAVTVYVSVLTAYLLAAYTVGNKLTSPQHVFISTLFIMFASVFAYTSWALMVAATELYASEAGRGEGSVQRYLPWIVGFCETAGMIGALIFMIDIRRNND